MRRGKHRLFKNLAVILLALLVLSRVHGAELKDGLDVVSETNRSAGKSQEKIDQLFD